MNIEKDNELARQVKSWYDMQSFLADKQVNPRSSTDARANEVHENTTIDRGLINSVGMLQADDNTKLPNNYFSTLVQLKSLEKWLAPDEDARENFTSTLKDDLYKGYIIELPGAHKVENRSDKEWYLPGCKVEQTG